MYGCESWTVKKAECRRIDAFELWCWKRFLRVPWTARRSNQSILREISPGHGHHQIVNTEVRLIIFFAAKDREALYSQQKQDQELTVAHIMNSLL